jgi:hypothetical protein
VEEYAQVQRGLRKLKQSMSMASSSSSSSAAAMSASEEHKEGHAGAAASSGVVGGRLSVVHHPATYIAPLPSLQQQLSKAITNRMMTKQAPSSSSLSAAAASALGSCGAASGDRSLSSLVTHDSPHALTYLLNLLGLEGLPELVAKRQQQQQQQEQNSGANDQPLAAVVASSRDLQRVVPNLMLVNEETKLRKQVLDAVRASNHRGNGSSALAAANSTVHHSHLDALPYFETLVRLFDQQAPHLLAEFVRLMSELFGAKASASPSSYSSSSAAAMPPALDSVLLSRIDMESHVERALRILPPISRGILAAPTILPSVRRPHLAAAGSGGNDLDVALLQDTNDTADALEFDATDTSDEKCGGGGSNADVALQAQNEQLRLERISARCALLVLSGRPVDAVLLRLRMADEEHDSSQEEAAILLAAAIVRENERSVLAAAAPSSSAAHPHAAQPHDDLAALERRLAPTFAVRDELFHHLFTHWLERQLTLQFEAQQAQASAPLDPHSLHASLSLSSLPRLDPRIAALMSPNFGAHAYLALLQEQKRAFVQKHIWQQMDNDAAAAAARRRKERDGEEDAAAPPMSMVQQQQASVPAPVVSQQLWPVLSPLLLPSPGSIQHQQQALLQQNRETLDVDLPMSCLLPELHAFAARGE